MKKNIVIISTLFLLKISCLNGQSLHDFDTIFNHFFDGNFSYFIKHLDSSSYTMFKKEILHDDMFYLMSKRPTVETTQYSVSKILTVKINQDTLHFNTQIINENVHINITFQQLQYLCLYSPSFCQFNANNHLDNGNLNMAIKWSYPLLKNNLYAGGNFLDYYQKKLDTTYQNIENDKILDLFKQDYHLAKSFTIKDRSSIYVKYNEIDSLVKQLKDEIKHKNIYAMEELGRIQEKWSWIIKVESGYHYSYWYEQSALHGNLNALQRLINYHGSSWQKSPDYKKQLYWLEYGYNSGYKGFILDLMLYNTIGIGKEQDLDLAQKYIEEIEEICDSPICSDYLASFYSYDKTPFFDFERAKYWEKISKLNGGKGIDISIIKKIEKLYQYSLRN